MSAEFDALSAEVNATIGIEKSAKALIDGFVVKLNDLAAQLAGQPAAADVQALADSLKAASDDLAADVAANTPPA